MDRVLFSAAEQDAWDAFVAASPSGHALQSWEWGEIKALSGWEPIRLGLIDNGGIRGTSQVLVRALPHGLGKLAYVPRGPVLDFEDADLLSEMLAALGELAADQGVISLKIEPEVVEPSRLGDELVRLGLSPAPPVQMRSTIWVDLTATEEEILRRQKQKTRYNTRLAERKGVRVSAGALEDVDAWYDLYLTTAHRDGFTVHDRRYYHDVLKPLLTKEMATLLLAHHEDDLLGGIIVFAFAHKAQYMYGASSNQKRNLMAPYLLQWAGMRWAKSRGARLYDMWGIPDRLAEDEDLWGVYRHKRGYGGETVRYVGAFDMVRSPLRHLALERIARPLFKRVTRLGV